MISQYLRFYKNGGVDHSTEYRFVPKQSNDPFELIDTLDPIGEHRKRIASLLDSIEYDVLSLINSLYAISNCDIKTVIDLDGCGLINGRTYSVPDEKVLAAVFACIACDENQDGRLIKIVPDQYCTKEEAESFAEELAGLVLRVMDISDGAGDAS